MPVRGEREFEERGRGVEERVGERESAGVEGCEGGCGGDDAVYGAVRESIHINNTKVSVQQFK